MDDATKAAVKVARQNIQAAKNRLNDALDNHEAKDAYDNLCEAESLLEAAVSAVSSARYSVGQTLVDEAAL